MPSPGTALERRAQQRIGATLKDKYRLERVLGVGGMATVYLGVHRNGLRVAVKVLHPELSLDDEHATRFVREGYVANSIEHRGAVRVLDDDIAEDGARFLVMELLEGETLEQRCKSHGGRLPLGEVLLLGHKLLDTLAAAHDKGVIHRDIKPENLFLTTEGDLKILDFGIARMNDASDRPSSDTGAGFFLGTPAFMPPEQALGRRDDIDARSDIWAVGATLFTLSTGQIVHGAKAVPELVICAATQPARSLADALPSAPPAAVGVIDRALRFYRDQRWPNARAMQAALADAYASMEASPISRASLPSLPPQRSFSARDEVMRSARASAPTLDADALDASIDPTSQPTVAERAAPSRPVLTPDPPAAMSETPSPVESSPASASRPSPSDVAAPPQAAPPEPSALPRDPATTTTTSPAARRPPRSTARVVAGALALAAALITAAGVGIAARSPRRAPLDAEPQEATPGCLSAAACVAQAGGKPSICRRDKGACVALETEQCRVLAQPGDVENDATLWIGAMFPVTGPEPFGPGSMNAVDLARRDFAETSNGLPPASPGAPSRPIAVIACDDTSDPRRAARHLVDDIGVPAIIGFARSKEVLDLAQEFFLPKGILALASNTATMLSSIPHPTGKPRLVLRTTTSATMIGPPMAALVSQVIEPELRRPAGLLSKNEPMRVALVRVANPTGLSYAEIFVSILRFNGKTVAQNGDHFLQAALPDFLHGSVESEADIAARAAEIVAFRPHVILGAARDAILAVEQRWPKSARFRPIYVAGAIEPDMLALGLREHPDLRSRIFTTDTSTTTDVVTKYVMHYNELFSPKVTSSTATVAPYDAFYLLAYAAASLGDRPITGEALAGAIHRFSPPGEPIDVGPAGIYPALHAIEAGKNVDLRGTVTSLDFDQETGDAKADFVVFCVGGREGAPEMVESGLRFDARSGKLEGALRCR